MYNNRYLRLDSSITNKRLLMKTNKNQIVDGIELSEGVEFIPEFHSTEVDLDRDIPDPNNFDVDVDENGPFITAGSAVNTMFMSPSTNDYDGDWVSECCGAELIINDQLCGDCKEHADPIPEDEEEYMKSYLDANPDFNAALNGHWEYV